MKWPDPLSKQSDELVENYPLTKEELRLIAAVWTAVRFSASCCLNGKCYPAARPSRP